MYYHLTIDQEKYFISQPETGMGYQLVEATKDGYSIKQKYLILNAEIAIDLDGNQDIYVRRVMKEGIFASKGLSDSIRLSQIRILQKGEYSNRVNEDSSNSKGSKDNPKETADGQEVFVRLSAYEDDKRVDRLNKCLRSGSYTTTMMDYLKCKNEKDDPIERYALPNDEKIEWAFHIQPKKEDILQRGKVQPANEKRGGGDEIYFENGTTFGTFITQTPY